MGFWLVVSKLLVIYSLFVLDFEPLSSLSYLFSLSIMVVVVGFLFFCALTEDLIERTKNPQDFACRFFLFFFLLVESQLPHRQHCQPMGSKFQPCGATMVGILKY